MPDFLEAQERPLCQRLGGGSASGKSTMRGSGKVDIMERRTAAQIDADEFKAMTEEYKLLSSANDPLAASFVHQESSYLARAAEIIARNRRVNIVTDGTNDGSLARCIKQIEALRADGYRVEGFFNTVPLDTALEWAAKRAAEEGRTVLEEVIRANHAAVSANFEELAPYFDRLFLFDNYAGGEGVSLLIASCERDALIDIIRADLYDAFLRKSSEVAARLDALRTIEAAGRKLAADGFGAVRYDNLTTMTPGPGGELESAFVTDFKLSDKLHDVTTYPNEGTAQAAKREVMMNLDGRLAGNADWENYVARRAGYEGRADYLQSFQTAYDMTPAQAEESLRSISQTEVSRLVQEWAHTSADSNPVSLAMQLAARDEFGLVDAVLDHLDKAILDDIAQYGTGDLLAQSRMPAYQAFLRAQYDVTQDYLKATNVDEVVLYRGAVLPGDIYSAEAQEAASMLWNGTLLDVELQPLSSFSIDMQTAFKFADHGAGDASTVMVVRVPADRILSTCRTGYGCLQEGEFVILGTEFEAPVAFKLSGSFGVVVPPGMNTASVDTANRAWLYSGEFAKWVASLGVQ